MNDENSGESENEAGIAAARIEEALSESSRSLSLAALGLTAVPAPVHVMTWLEELDLSDNGLDRLPRSLSRLTGLRVLDLSGNILTELPDWIGSLDSLESLLVSRNRLTVISFAPGDLRSLSLLDVRDNNLSEIPDALSRSGFQALTDGNPLLGAANHEVLNAEAGIADVEVAAEMAAKMAKQPTPPPFPADPLLEPYAPLPENEGHAPRRRFTTRRVSLGTVSALVIVGGIALAVAIPTTSQGVQAASRLTPTSSAGGESPRTGAVDGSASPIGTGLHGTPTASGVPSSGKSPTSSLTPATPTTAEAPAGTKTNASSQHSSYPLITGTYDDIGITNDSATATGDFDGSGDASFSEQALTAAGASPGATISADGFAFRFPDVPAGADDNTVAQGQDVSVSGSGSRLGFLISASFGPAEGTGEIHYTDGTVQSFQLQAQDWFVDTPMSGASNAISSGYQDRTGNTVFQNSGNISAVPVSLSAGKTIAYVQLPNLGHLANGDPALHIFDIELS